VDTFCQIDDNVGDRVNNCIEYFLNQLNFSEEQINEFHEDFLDFVQGLDWNKKFTHREINRYLGEKGLAYPPIDNKGLILYLETILGDRNRPLIPSF
jgi:hypothetical protein